MHMIFRFILLLFSTMLVAQKPLNKCFYFKFNEKDFNYTPYNPSNAIVIYSKKDKRVKSVLDGTIVKIGEEYGNTKSIIIKKDEKFFSYSGIDKISNRVKIGREIEKGEFLGRLKKEEGYFKFDFQVFDRTNSITYKESIECDIKEK